jgi:hypothetical protein
MGAFWAIALMMEAARTSETLVNFYQTTRRYNPEDTHLQDVMKLGILFLTYVIGSIKYKYIDSPTQNCLNV